MKYWVYNTRKIRQGKIADAEHWIVVYKGFPEIVKRLKKGVRAFELVVDDKSIIHFEQTDCEQRPKCDCGNDILLQHEVFKYKNQSGTISVLYKCLECQALD